MKIHEIILFILAFIPLIIRWLMLIVYTSHTSNQPEKLSLRIASTKKRFIRNSQILLTASLSLFVFWLGIAANVPLGVLLLLAGVGLFLILLSPIGTNRTLDKIIKQIEVDKKTEY